MNIKEMHYEFKRKLNKIDGQQNRNLVIPEIDSILNEALELFIDLVAYPRLRNQMGFEKTQKNIDDIRTLVETDVAILTSVLPGDRFLLPLPKDYKYYLKSIASLVKESCHVFTNKVFIREHDDNFMESFFDVPSFKWRSTSALFSGEGLIFYTDGTFSVNEVYLSYIKTHPYIHNAEDYRGGTYTKLDGTVLTGTEDCILPEQTHREIVDLAVMIATGDLQVPDYSIKIAKLNMNNLKQN